MNVPNKGSIRNNSDGTTIEPDSLFDSVVEQDSLETSKVAETSTKTNDGGGSSDDGKGANGGKSSQFLPFAHIGTNWSNEHAVKQQINTTVDTNDHNCSNNTTNQFIQFESTNQTNAFVDVQTNHSSLINNQTTENKYHDIPGIIHTHIHTTIQ